MNKLNSYPSVSITDITHADDKDELWTVKPSDSLNIGDEIRLTNNSTKTIELGYDGNPATMNAKLAGSIMTYRQLQIENDIVLVIPPSKMLLVGDVLLTNHSTSDIELTYNRPTNK